MTSHYKLDMGFYDLDHSGPKVILTYWDDSKCEYYADIISDRKKIVPGIRRAAYLALKKFWPQPKRAGIRMDAEEIRAVADMLQVVRKYTQVPLTESNQVSVVCPLHTDKVRSMSLNREKKVWVCYAGCGGGDIFSLVMKAESCKFIQAVRIVKEYGN